MKKKFLAMAIAAVIAVTSLAPSAVKAADEKKSTVTVTRVVNQCLYAGENVEQDVIDMYVSSGWSWNETEHQFEREVVYSDEDMTVNNETVSTNSNGEVEVNVEDGDVITVKSVTGETEVSKEVEAGSILTVNENVYVNDVIKKMDDITIAEQSEDGRTQIGQSNGELPKTGAIVSCNRFNGPNGDGRYYSSRTSSKAIKNFYHSDCDYALGRSLNCLKDYLPNAADRYCSLYSSSHYGKCSTIIGHSTRYHRH